MANNKQGASKLTVIHNNFYLFFRLSHPPHNSHHSHSFLLPPTVFHTNLGQKRIGSNFIIKANLVRLTNNDWLLNTFYKIHKAWLKNRLTSILFHGIRLFNDVCQKVRQIFGNSTTKVNLKNDLMWSKAVVIFIHWLRNCILDMQVDQKLFCFCVSTRYLLHLFFPVRGLELLVNVVVKLNQFLDC